jgi:hypothetical protein
VKRRSGHCGPPAGKRFDAGSHVILHHADRPGRVTIPVHAGVTLKPKTLLSILDQAGVSVDELVNLL